MAAHLYEPQQSDGHTDAVNAADPRPPAAEAASEPVSPAPDPAAVVVDVRVAAVNRLREMSVKHAQHAWERRRRDPLSAYGLALLYVQPDDRERRQHWYRLCAATKLWLAGQENRNLARLLYDLGTAVDARLADPSFDPRAELANRVDQPMAADAYFAGLGVSSLDTYTGSWADVCARVDHDADIPACLRIVLTDGTIIVCERRGLGEFNELTVRSTASLDFAPGHSPFPWGRVSSEQLHADPYHQQPLRWLTALCEQLWQHDPQRLTYLKNHSRPSGGRA